MQKWRRECKDAYGIPQVHAARRQKQVHLPMQQVQQNRHLWPILRSEWRGWHRWQQSDASYWERDFYPCECFHVYNIACHFFHVKWCDGVFLSSYWMGLGMIWSIMHSKAEINNVIIQSHISCLLHCLSLCKVQSYVRVSSSIWMLNGVLLCSVWLYVIGSM